MEFGVNIEVFWEELWEVHAPKKNKLAINNSLMLFIMNLVFPGVAVKENFLMVNHSCNLFIVIKSNFYNKVGYLLIWAIFFGPQPSPTAGTSIWGVCNFGKGPLLVYFPY